MGRNLNILYIAHYYRARDSAAITTHGIIEGLINRGNTVTLLTPDRCPYTCPCSLECNTRKEFKVVRTPTFLPEKLMALLSRNFVFRIFIGTVAYLPLLIYALKKAHDEKIDVVMCMHHSFHLASFCGFVLASIHKVPLVIKAHDIILHRIAEPSVREIINLLGPQLLNLIFLERALRSASYILVTGVESKEIIQPMFKLNEEQVVVHPNGVRSENFIVDSKESAMLRRKLDLKNNKIAIFVGAFGPDRRLDLLIKSLPYVVAEYPDFKVLMVGEGLEEPKLKKMAASLGVEDHIIFLGAIDYRSIPLYISIADVAIGPLSSTNITYGSTPRKVIEYLASEKPVISCKMGVSRDLLIHGYNGLIISMDADELAAAIIRLLKDKKLANELGQNGRKHIRENYDWKTLNNKLDNLIVRIV